MTIRCHRDAINDVLLRATPLLLLLHLHWCRWWRYFVLACCIMHVAVVIQLIVLDSSNLIRRRSYPMWHRLIPTTIDGSVDGLCVRDRASRIYVSLCNDAIDVEYNYYCYRPTVVFLALDDRSHPQAIVEVLLPWNDNSCLARLLLLLYIYIYIYRQTLSLSNIHQIVNIVVIYV